MRAGNRTTDDGPPTGGAPDVRPTLAGPELLDPPTGILDLSRSLPIAEVVHRRRVQVGGRVRSVRVRPWGEHLAFEVVVADPTGAITVAFAGRRSLGGVGLGSWLTVEGMVGLRDGKLVISNPAYDLRPLGPEVR
jgi:hypothetical protein